MTSNDLLTPGNITFSIGIVTILFSIYKSYRNPQISSDLTIAGLTDRVTGIEKTLLDVRETQLKNVQDDIKNLTSSVNELSKTVVKLSTIIDERIPKGSPGLTPPGA